MTAETILVIFGDTQIGSTTALAPPTFTIHDQHQDETQLVHHNKMQAWLWECWTDYWEYIYTLVGIRGKKRKNRLIVVHMGDVIDGNHHGTYQIIHNIKEQVTVALDVLRPIADASDAFYGILGTEAHAGPTCEDEIEIYKDLGAAAYDHNLMLDIDGKLHDFAHHGRVGTRPWTSAAANIGVEVCLECGSLGLPYPDYIWRAHNHIIDDSGLKLPNTRVICLPSWQLKTTFVHRVSANVQRSDIGGVIVNGGILDTSKIRYVGQPDLRKVLKP